MALLIYTSSTHCSTLVYTRMCDMLLVDTVSLVGFYCTAAMVCNIHDSHHFSDSRKFL